MKDTYDVRESESLQHAIDMIDNRKKPMPHALLAMTKALQRDIPIESVRFALLNLSALLELKNTVTLSYAEASEMYTLLRTQDFQDAQANASVSTVLSQLKYIYLML